MASGTRRDPGVTGVLDRVQALAKAGEWALACEVALRELGTRELANSRERVGRLADMAAAAAGDEEARRKRRETESDALAEIGRIIDSTLDIDEVYERFAEQVKKLVPFDRIVIAEVNLGRDTIWPLYVAGLEMPGPGVLEERPIKATPFSRVIYERQPALFDGATTDLVLREFPGERFGAMVGLRSLICVPLISNDRVLGFFSLRSTEESAYGEGELRLVERVAAQISGAIANSQLYDRTQRDAREREAIAAIGVAVNSDLELDTVYDRMAEELLRLIPYDRLSVVLRREDGNSEVAFVRGARPLNLEVGTVFVPRDANVPQPPDGWHFVSQSSLDSGPGERPALSAAGLKSWISVCLGDPAGPEGFLVVAAYGDDRYERRDVELLERVAAQVTPAIVNARLFRRTGEIAVLEERNRIARDIHDSMAQHLAAIILAINVARNAARSSRTVTLDQLDEIRELAERALRDARRSVWDLRASPLQGVSLVEALQAELNAATADASGPALSSQFEVEGPERTLPPGVEAAFYRICQESLSNVRRHAGAAGVRVQLTFSESEVRLTVRDDGDGFEPEAVADPTESGGFGLLGMHERCRLLGGYLCVVSSPGEGAVVQATIPT